MSVSTKQANEVHFDKIAKSLSHQASRSAQELAKRYDARRWLGMSCLFIVWCKICTRCLEELHLQRRLNGSHGFRVWSRFVLAQWMRRTLSLEPHLKIHAGLLSQQLSPYCKSVVGVDISQAMVDLYNESARNQGLSGDELRAVCFDVLDNKFSSDCLNGQKFDVVVVSNVLLWSLQLSTYRLMESAPRHTTISIPSTT